MTLSAPRERTNPMVWSKAAFHSSHCSGGGGLSVCFPIRGSLNSSKRTPRSWPKTGPNSFQTRHALRPTARALSLAERVRQTLELAQSTLSFRETFCPGTETRTFRIGLPADLEALSLMTRTEPMNLSFPGAVDYRRRTIRRPLKRKTYLIFAAGEGSPP
jgi:hypothetical protein